MEMKNAFDELISALDMAKKRLSVLEGRSTETFPTKMQKKKKTQNNLQSVKVLWISPSFVLVKYHYWWHRLLDPLTPPL